MKKIKSYFIMKHYILCTFFFPFLMLFMFACNGKNEQQSSQVQEAKSSFVLKKQEVSKKLRIPAELLPYERAEINAKVEGYVQKVMVDIGDNVRQGQILAVLEAPEAVAAYAEANAKMQEAQARYIGSKDRYERLNQASLEEGIVATGDLISTENQKLADSAAVNAAKSTAEAYRQLQEYLTLRAPFNGRITKRTVDPGNLVGNNTQSLFVLETPDRLRLRVHVPESYTDNVPASEQLVFSVDAIEEKTFEARLSRKSGSIDPATRTEIWEYEFDNSKDELKPGMYALAQLDLKRSDPSFVVPYTAVVTSQERKFIVKVHNGTAEWVDIRQGISMNEGVEVFGDLREGDTILTRGSEEIKTGSQVQTQL
jgi:RND family efflux transporter MFP subunit